MRIAVISDIHGNLPALEAVHRDIKRKSPDLVFNLGDCVSGPLWPEETAQYLIAENWLTVRGNHDRHLVDHVHSPMTPSDAHAYSLLSDESKAWLKQLPSHMEHMENIFLCHGTPSADDIYLTEELVGGRTRMASPEYVQEHVGSICNPLVVCGHSHIPRVLWLESGQTVMNAGSVGLPAFDNDTPHKHVMEVGSPHARYTIVTRVGTRWSFEERLVNYDWDRASRKAERNQRGDWAGALKTGYFRPIKLLESLAHPRIEEPYEDF
ncbi:metallophosphoesterase family protein [Pseudovibrio sp. Tun.PSC04-5.I4]|uniref:metallophosphoesterase family protein n=1 Tax=Pseudovibrio sp. Tun.PSC04-5.I4 TaxID=1798213 RepID=UPI000885D18A|nr:metallophosphoesterase family protein [Pseudovibrio sp. Tun.PSC04-5.I4]SDR32360.1 phosphoesterase, MJ0936 family [Pseudovibrio sp. Tun.PSC04-5.I4]